MVVQECQLSETAQNDLKYLDIYPDKEGALLLYTHLIVHSSSLMNMPVLPC